MGAFAHQQCSEEFILCNRHLRPLLLFGTLAAFVSSVHLQIVHGGYLEVS